MNTDERRAELLSKANSLIDTISENMRTIENVESAKKKFLRADSKINLAIPIEGCGGMTDVFEIDEIFDERGIEKIKAFILNELEFLEESALRILDTAGFHTDLPKEPEPVEIPFAPEPEDIEEEDDSDMIIVPEKLEKKAIHSTKPLAPDKVEQIKELTQQGVRASEIARQTGVSHQSVQRYAKKFTEGVPNKEANASGRSASRRPDRG